MTSRSPSSASTSARWRRSRRISRKLADPLARALCWAAMWDLTRDGEMPAREFVELVARHAPAEKDSLLVERVTSQARSAIDLYGDPAQPERRARAPPPGRRRRRSTPPTSPPELRLIWARILVATAASEESLAKVAAMLDGRRQHPRHRCRHRPPLADRRTARRGGPRGRRADPRDHGVRPERHRPASRHGLSRRPADRGRQGRGLAAHRRPERADAQGLEGRDRRRALGRVDVGDPSRLLHRLGRGRRDDGARPRSRSCSARTSSAISTRCPRSGRSARSTRPRCSPSACTRATSSMTRWSRRSTSRWRAASSPARRCGSFVKAGTARCEPSAPAIERLRAAGRPARNDAAARDARDARRHPLTSRMPCSERSGPKGSFFATAPSTVQEHRLRPARARFELVRKRLLPLVGDGGGVWSFIHVADAAEATAAAVERGTRGAYNVVDDDPASVAAWLPALARRARRQATDARAAVCRAHLRRRGGRANDDRGSRSFERESQARAGVDARAPELATGVRSRVTDRERFLDELRPVAFAIAYRMLSSVSEAEDVVQEALLRVYQALDTGQRIASPRSFVATVTTRLAINELRSARVRRERYFGEWLPEPIITEAHDDPAEHAEMAESLSLAMLVVLETLSPEQRAVFLLHDVFDYGTRRSRRSSARARTTCASSPSALDTTSRSAGLATAATREQRDVARPSVLRSHCSRETSPGSRRSSLTTSTLTGDGGGKVPALAHSIHGREHVARTLMSLVPSRARASQALPCSATEINGSSRSSSFATGSRAADRRACSRGRRAVQITERPLHRQSRQAGPSRTGRRFLQRCFASGGMTDSLAGG